MQQLRWHGSLVWCVALAALLTLMMLAAPSHSARMAHTTHDLMATTEAANRGQGTADGSHDHAGHAHRAITKTQVEPSAHTGRVAGHAPSQPCDDHLGLDNECCGTSCQLVAGLFTSESAAIAIVASGRFLQAHDQHLASTEPGQPDRPPSVLQSV